MFTNKLNNFINFIFKKKRNDSDIESAKGEVISLGKRAGLGYEERIMLNNVLRFSSTEVSEAMVPRANIVAVSKDADFKEQFSNKLHYIGDIALGYEIVFQEAKARDVPLLNHAAHLVIHGVLHLVGYSHESVEDEFKMQKIETKVLKEVGIPNPYAY